MEKVLVTGGAGFIGSHLVESLLNKGFKVVVVDNLLRGNKIPKRIADDVELIVDDVCKETIVYRHSKGCKYIFHFAAMLGVDIVADNPVKTMDVEVIGMRNVMKAALKNSVSQIIYSSTSGIYGHSAIEKSVQEHIQVDPRTSYAIAKRFNEIYLAAQFEENGIESIALRFFNIYGPRQDERMVIPRFISQAKQNKPITIFGKGHQTRDFTFIDDTIKSILLLLGKTKGSEIFNVSNENELEIISLANIIKNYLGSNSKILCLDAPTKRYDFEVERRIGDSSKLYEYTGYKPDTNIEKGLSIILSQLID